MLKAQAPEGTEAEDEDVFQFVDERTLKYTEMIDNNIKIDNIKIDNDNNEERSNGAASLEADDDESVVFGEGDEIDIDDI